MKINNNFPLLPESYLFSTVAAKLREYKFAHPEADIIRMDIGDVTLPIPDSAIKAMHRAVEEMAAGATFHGYGPEQGYDFLRTVVAEEDYRLRGVEIAPDEIFISDGAKSDLGNLGDIYCRDSIVAIPNPGYPVYADSNVMDGRGGAFIDGGWSRFVYLDYTPVTGFNPLPPDVHADVIFLCSPANPTGAAFTREQLKLWIDYALRNESLIIYDSAYCAYVSTPGVVRSIYEIEGARQCAIEVRSFSKTAGFTGLRCGYTVVPHDLFGYGTDGKKYSLRKLWLRRQTTKFNGASYVIQRAAEALYSPEGKAQVAENVGYYMENARLIRETLRKVGYEVTGGIDSPYVWAKLPGHGDSWQLFETLLAEKHISCTPGIGFGSLGAGYIRLTGFNTHERTQQAMSNFEC